MTNMQGSYLLDGVKLIMQPANFPNISTVSSTDGKKLKKLFVTMHIMYGM